MKRVMFFCIVVLTGVALSTAGALAVDGSSSFPAAKSSRPPTRAEIQQRLYYGYAPPPPILHTWPGGYRVIIHEMLNTLAGHILGQY
jgi:hypothetical protein